MFAGVDPLVSVAGVLLLLLAGLSWLSRRLSGASLGSSGERVALTQQHVVHLIELGGVRLLVGTGPSGAPRVLAELGPVEEVASERAPVRAPRSWFELLAGLLGVAGGR